MTTRCALITVVFVTTNAASSLAIPPPLPTAQGMLDDAVAAAAPELATCSALATARHVYGDVRARVYGASRWRTSPSRSLGAHAAALAACVQRAIASHFTLLGSFDDAGVEHTELLGTPKAVLPAADRLTPIWLRAIGPADKGARDAAAALRKLVPPDYAVTKDGCLKTERMSATAVESEWAGTVGARIPPLWTKLPGKTLGHRIDSSVWLAAGALMTQSARGLCLDLIGPERQAALRAELEAVGTGWVGGFLDVLLHPRVELPRDRKYTRVATHGGRICALTVTGEVVCVGPTDPPLPPAPGAMVSLALGDDFACGLDARSIASCWGNMVAPPPGVFVRIGAGSRHACGLRKTGEIECWGPRAWFTPPSTQADFIDLAVGAGTCGLHRDRSVECWGSSSFVLHPLGAFTSIAMNDTRGCGIRVDRSVGCWHWASEPLDSPMPERFKEVAVGGIYDVCGRRDDDSVVCWTPSPRVKIPPPAVKLAQLTGSHDTFCGVRNDGGVECWGDPWPGREQSGRSIWEAAPRVRGLFGLLAAAGLHRAANATPELTLSGRVVDEWDRPIAGAEVMVCADFGPCGFIVRDAISSPSTLTELARTLPRTTWADGSSAVATTQSDGTWTARVALDRKIETRANVHAVFTAPHREIVEREGHEAGLGSQIGQIRLRPSSALDIDPRCDGAPCAGVIEMASALAWRFQSRHVERLTPGAHTVTVYENRGEPGERRATAAIEVGYAVRAQRVSLALQAVGTGKSIRGTVKPGAGSPVHIHADCAGVPGPVRRQATADAAGAFELRDVGPPPCFVGLSGPDSQQVKVDALPATGIVLPP